MRKALCALIASATIGLGLAAVTPALASGTCPPSDAVWTNNAKYTGQPYPHTVGSLDGYDYYLNNDQWNEQSSSNQTMWLESDNDFGVCSYQPASPDGDKAYPDAVLNLNDPVGTDPPPAGPAIDSFSAISSSATETQPASTYGEFQWMWDVFVGPSSPAADQVEIEIITNQTGEGTPSGTSMGTATFGGATYDVYYDTALDDDHLYYSFIATSDSGSATAPILSALDWLNSNAPTYGLSFPLTQALDSISGGWEISSASDGSGNPNGGFTCSSYSLTLTS
jgi:hypothetical protein